MSDNNSSDGSERPQDTWSGAAGVFPTVEFEGVTYTFALDTPGMLLEMEKLSKEWGRARFKEAVAALEDRNKPGTIDYDFAVKETDRYMEALRSGAFSPPNGPEFHKYTQTIEGQLCPVVAALRVKHQDATAVLVLRMIQAKPVEMREVTTLLKKAMDAVARTASAATEAASKSPTPAPAG